AHSECHTGRQLGLALPDRVPQTVNFVDQAADCQSQRADFLDGSADFRAARAIRLRLRAKDHAASRSAVAMNRRGPDFARSRRPLLQAKLPPRGLFESAWQRAELGDGAYGLLVGVLRDVQTQLRCGLFGHANGWARG